MSDSKKKNTPAAAESGGTLSHTEKRLARRKNRRHLHPGSQLLSGWMTPVGLLLRLLPAYCLAAGLYLFADNAFGFGTPKAIFLPMIAAVLLLHGAMCWNRIVSVIGWILTGVGAVLLFVGQNPLTLLVNLGRGLYNSAISHMMTVGYGVLYVFKLDSPLDAETELAYARLAFGILQVICAVIIAHCTAKKLRVWPIAVIAAFSYTLVFLYNISTSKWGFALSVAGICGLLCMMMADKYAALPKHRTVTAADLGDPGSPMVLTGDTAPDIGDPAPYLTDKKSAKAFSLRGSAVVGFCSALCCVLALLAAAIPAAKVREPWREYDTIDTVMETIRAYEMALITGEDMQIADLGLTGAAEILEARSSLATPRYFTGKEVLEIQSNLNLPVYLRSWVSTTFSGDLWHVADEETRDAFSNTFSDDFRAEDITYRFFRNLNEKLVRYKTSTSYVNHEDDGFMTTLISLKNLGVAGNILFLPSRLDSEVSLLEYGTLDLPYKKNWINYFDGIAYSRAFHKGAKYSAVAYLPLYKEEDWMQTLNRKLMAYGNFMDIYAYVGKDLGTLLKNESVPTDVYDSAYSLRNLSEYYLSLDDAGRDAFFAELNEVFLYNDYVDDSGIYTSLTEDETLNQKLRALALEIIFSEPLPETGLTTTVDGEELDFTDILAKRAMQYTVGDAASFVYATADGDIYVDYGNGVTLEEGDEILYMRIADSGVSSGAVELSPELKEDLDLRADHIVFQPFVTAREVRGTDGSLIDIEYDVTDPDAFMVFLSGGIDGMTYDVSLYYTAFAQRIAKYLSENMTYTLTPTLPETEDEMSSVERFLFVTQEGYCVQYATSATLLLRSLGIPTRYVEGYIAPKFVRNEAEDRSGNYICTVKDYNAHAWCEIYLPSYGWLTTEVTTPYYSEMYDPYETISYNRGDYTSSGSSETTTVDDTEDVEEEDTFWDLWGGVITTVLICALAAAAVIWLLCRFLESRRAMRYRHAVMLRDAKQHLVEEGDRRAVSSALYDNLRRVAAVFDIRPVTGETPLEYAHRLDVRFPLRGGAEDSVSSAAQSVYAFIAKNEFGSSDEIPSPDELAAIADYTVRLEDRIRAEAGILTKFRLKYFLGLME